eukprot:1967415-Prymnesium_polylepis.1
MDPAFAVSTLSAVPDPPCGVRAYGGAGPEAARGGDAQEKSVESLINLGDAVQSVLRSATSNTEFSPSPSPSSLASMAA